MWFKGFNWFDEGEAGITRRTLRGFFRHDLFWRQGCSSFFFFCSSPFFPSLCLSRVCVFFVCLLPSVLLQAWPPDSWQNLLNTLHPRQPHHQAVHQLWAFLHSLPDYCIHQPHTIWDETQLPENPCWSGFKTPDSLCILLRLRFLLPAYRTCLSAGIFLPICIPVNLQTTPPLAKFTSHDLNSFPPTDPR